MSKRETRLLALACTFIGIVIGFLMSPVKAGISCGNNNTCENVYGGPRKFNRKYNKDGKDENIRH